MGRRSARVKLAKLLGLATLALALMGGDRPPWRARKRPDVMHNKLAAARIAPTDWPAEPASPSQVDSGRFAKALRTLCGWMPKGRSERYAASTLDAAAEFDVDPFLLGALIYRESRCRADKEDLGGVGLTLLAPNMYRGSFRGREFRYRVHEGGTWQERSVHFPKYGFFAGLRKAEVNLYLTAGLLRAWRDQEQTVHAYFEQVPHRHYISHWVWGDRVPSARAEDRVLSDRRRLLQYYGSHPQMPPIEGLGLALHAPLDGAPRVVSSGLGSERDGGKRAHRGIDIESEFGETVRAVADGKVIYVGVDLVGRQQRHFMKRAEINRFPRREMGRGGRFVCMLHDTPQIEGGLRTCYMHLERVDVDRGAVIKGGEPIGTVGRTGMRSSAPHLHLEFRTDAGILDPLAHLRPLVIGRPVEWDGHRIVETGQRRKRRRRSH